MDAKLNAKENVSPEKFLWFRILDGESKDPNSYCNPTNGFPNDILNYLKSYVHPAIRETTQTILYHLNMLLPEIVEPYLSLSDEYNIRSPPNSGVRIIGKFGDLGIDGDQIKYVGKYPNKNKKNHSREINQTISRLGNNFIRNINEKLQTGI